MKIRLLRVWAWLYERVARLRDPSVRVTVQPHSHAIWYDPEGTHQEPPNPKHGDEWLDGDVWRVYNGKEWRPRW